MFLVLPIRFAWWSPLPCGAGIFFARVEKFFAGEVWIRYVSAAVN